MSTSRIGNPLTHARRTDPPTSKAAAIGVAGALRRSGSHLHFLLRAYSDVDNLTDSEAAALAGLNPRSCYWRRCTDLRQAGLIVIVDDGGVALTRADVDSGEQRIACAITYSGRVELARLDAKSAA